MFAQNDNNKYVDNSQNEVRSGNDIREGVKGIDMYGDVVVGTMGDPKLSKATFTENGTYAVPDGYDGYGTVKVSVPAGDFLTIRRNLSYYSSNVTWIADYAFAYTPIQECYLTDMTGAGNGSHKFEYCSRLKAVTMPSAPYISMYDFYNCTSLEYVSVPQCQGIQGSAFMFCRTLKSANFPICTSVGANAFSNCGLLQSVYLPNCIEISDGTFFRCSSLNNVNLNMCSYLGTSAFRGCENLQSIILPVVKQLRTNTFWECFNLSYVDLGSQCSYIQTYAFDSCYKLNAVRIDTSWVCRLANSNAFSNCSSLAAIIVPESLVSQYKASTNWSYFSSKIVGS